ncbi:hypothetical protein VMCG_06782 [Cytospora schulzeri]|uniref:Uncharacterized protein n=1 Tax=Cytospora schulzeri TaxID=448051 RepID=A0A423W5V4_9PEZI|nr:hypothetical protein VMCG_06782 [Valsa malicola]
MDVIEVIPESGSKASQEKSRSHSKSHKKHHRHGHKSSSREAHQEGKRSRHHEESFAAGGGYSSKATSGHQAGAYASRQTQDDSQETEHQRQQRIQQGYNHFWPSGYDQTYGQGPIDGPSQSGPSPSEARQTPASGDAFHYVYDGTEGPDGERVGSG